jgi:hypothetical protein
VIQEILCIKDEEKKLLILCMLWRWWLQRNKKNKGGQRLSADEVIRKARYWVSESLQYCKTEKKESRVVSPSQHWQRPTGEMLKINIDGSRRQTARVARALWSGTMQDKREAQVQGDWSMLLLQSKLKPLHALKLYRR